MAYTQLQKIENPSPAAGVEWGINSVIDGYYFLSAKNISPMDFYKRGIDGIWTRQLGLLGRFGLSMSGQYMIAVVPSFKLLRIYKKDDSSTILQFFDETASGATTTFGNSSCMNENYIVVGDQAKTSNTGQIYIYEKTGTDTWTEYANNPVQLDIDNEQDFFGSSVAVDGDSIIVGAMGDNNKKGAVYIFQKDIDTGIWEQTQKLFASDGLENDQFGESLSASSGYFVTGASLKDNAVGETNSGAAYVFKYSTDWYEVDKLTGVDESDYEGNHFGESVYINGNHIIVGSPGARSDQGVADIFHKKRSWGHLKKLVASDGSASDSFGTSVSISGRFAIVGATGYDSGVTGGAVYIFEDPPIALRLAQEFEVNSQYLPSKASVYLKRCGDNSNNFWPIYNTTPTVIDATNFSTITKESNIIIFDDTIGGFTGNGFMVMHEGSPSFSVHDDTTINYPIRAINPDTYNLWIRCINPINNNLEIEVLIDGNISKTINTTIGNPSDGLEWSWINTTIVIPDNRDHILGIRIKENNVAIDKIYIDVDDNTPYSEGPDYTSSPYLTTHMRVYNSLNNEPFSPIFVYDYKNSITEIIQDDWYNFNIKVLDDSHSYNSESDFVGDYYLVMATTGSSTSNFVVWELVDNDEYQSPASAIKF